MLSSIFTRTGANHFDIHVRVNLRLPVRHSGTDGTPVRRERLDQLTKDFRRHWDALAGPRDGSDARPSIAHASSVSQKPASRSTMSEADRSRESERALVARRRNDGKKYFDWLEDNYKKTLLDLRADDLQTRRDAKPSLGTLVRNFPQLVMGKSGKPHVDERAHLGKRILQAAVDCIPAMHGSKPDMANQKALVRLTIRYAQFVCPEQPETLLLPLIQNAAKIHADGLARNTDPQGAMVRGLEKHLHEFPVSTLLAFAREVTPQHIAAFSLSPPAGHSDIFLPHERKRGSDRPLDKLPKIMGAVPNWLYQASRNLLSGRPSCQERMLHLLLGKALAHPQMTQDDARTYLAHLLDNVEQHDPQHAHALSRALHEVTGSLTEQEQVEIDRKRTPPADRRAASVASLEINEM